MVKPLEKIKLDESYGEEVELANFAAEYFQEAAYAARVGSSNNDIEKIKTTILDFTAKFGKIVLYITKKTES